MLEEAPVVLVGGVGMEHARHAEIRGSVQRRPRHPQLVVLAHAPAGGEALAVAGLDVPVLHVVFLLEAVRARDPLAGQDQFSFDLGRCVLIHQDVGPHFRLGRPLRVQDADDPAQRRRCWGRCAVFHGSSAIVPRRSFRFAAPLPHVLAEGRLAATKRAIAALAPLAAQEDGGGVALGEPDVVPALKPVRASTELGVTALAHAGAAHGPVGDPAVGDVVVGHRHFPVQADPPLHDAAGELRAVWVAFGVR